MSLFRLVKYSSLLFFLGKYKFKLFRVLSVLLFAAVTSLLYGDVEAYLAREHPGTVIYALLAKIFIVYGALLFVLLQFKPHGVSKGVASPPSLQTTEVGGADDSSMEVPEDRLAGYANLDKHERLQSRAEALMKKR